MNARFGFVLAVVCAGFLAACGGGGGGGGGSLPSIPATTVPSAQPTATPSGQPTATPSAQPTATPGSQPTATPGAQPTPTPTIHPTATPVPTPTPQPTATPTLAPAQVSVTVGAQATSAPMPSGAGFTGTMALPAGSGTLVITDSQAIPVDVNNGVSNRLAYFTLTAQGGPVTLQGLPGLKIQIPATGYPSGVYYVAYYDASGPVAAWESTTTNGASADAGHSVSIPATSSPAISIPAGSTIDLAVYYGAYMPPINVKGCVGGNQNPLASRSLVGVHPITSGNSFAYTGALTQTIVRSSPCPMPTATANAQVAVSVTETAAPGSAPAGTQTDEHAVETSAFSTYTQTVTTDSYVASNSGSLYDLGEQATDQGGNTVTTSYALPGIKFAQVPEGAGNQWSSGAPSTVFSQFADGSHYARTYAGSGTYTENDVLPGGLASVLTENADGSGSYVIGTYDQNGNPSSLPITVSAPSGNKVTMTYNNTPHSIPLWYALPFAPYSDVTQDMGVQNIDAACGHLPAGFNPTQAEKIVRTTTTVDAVLGYTDTRTTTTWDQNVTASQGPLCVEIHDVENFYYDYNYDTTFLVYRTNDGNPLQTNTIDETYSLSSAPVANIIRHSAAIGRALNARVAAGQAGITFARSVERAHRLATFARALHHARLGGRR